MKNKLSLTGMVILVNLIIFIPFIFFFHPIYNTNEDVYILYLLSGGFGTPPTELLHYNYEMHPYLNIFIKNLFVSFPHINWYSIVLLLSHYAACCIILYQILRKLKFLYAVLFYVTLFVIFEGKFILDINHTNTAVLLTISALSLLLTPENNRLPVATIIATVTILLLASFFRLLAIIPLIGVSLPFLVLNRPKNEIVKRDAALLLSGGLIFLFNHLHQSYYRSAIANWQQEEEYRQIIYSFYNHHNLTTPVSNTKWDTEMNIIANGCPLDTGFVSTQKLLAMRKDLLHFQRDAGNTPPPSKNWFWINNRIYFLVILLFLLLSLHNRKLLLVTSLSLTFAVAGLYILHLYAKSPEYLKIGCLLLIGSLIGNFIYETGNPKTYRNLPGFIMLLLISWGAVQLYKKDQKNIEETKKFKLAISETSVRRDKLFVLTSDVFRLQAFYVFDDPAKYYLHNFLTSEHFLQNLHHSVFRRFNIHHMKDLPLQKNVLFWGKRIPAFETYLYKVTGRELLVSEPFKEFQHGQVRTITFKN